MIHIYIILLFVVSVLSSIITLLIVNKDKIRQRWRIRKNKRKLTLKNQVESIVLNYLTELKNESSDDKHITK